MYRINKAFDIPAQAQMELPKSMYSVRPVNGIAAGIQPVNLNANNQGNSTTRGPLNESNRNSVKDSEKRNNSPRDHNKEIKSAGKRKRSGSRSPPRNSNKSPGGKPAGGKMTNDNLNKVGKDDKESEEIIAKLEARQKVVIEKLLHLREVLNNLGASSVTSTAPASSSGRDEVPQSVEVVVNADPGSPPYSVVFLAKLLRDTYGSDSVSLQSYQHSSCLNKAGVNSNLFNQPLDSDSKARKTIKVSVIWKQVEDGEPELLVQPSVQAPVTGEANVARYLSRLLPSVYPIHYDTLSWDDIIRVDAALERAADGINDLSELEQQLQSNQPCLLGEATIADFVTFSAVASYLKRNPKGAEKFPRVTQWFSACQSYGGFRL